MTDLKPFITHAEARGSAAIIVKFVADKDAFLLWKACLKRMRNVPRDVVLKAAGEMEKAMALAGVILEPDVGALAMDFVGEMIWMELSEEGHYQWLLKVK